ncbi:Protein kinase domain [Macleaya cordata]|uniref:Protein kinase domain n=1 Tax=Macleaya cordata TaxID=56857 RepID=A0A200QEF6_MACCD|nr:Protein kinase domain [Macleaya cordata]
MGCITSKDAISVKPSFEHNEPFRDNGSAVSGSSLGILTMLPEPENKKINSGNGGNKFGKSMRKSSKVVEESMSSFRLGNLNKYIEGEQIAAGWPDWLSAAAGEAIQGWVPLRADSFEKLEKIGQGTYSNVFRARDLATGRIVALKKVRFENFEPESVRFMAREIMILRKLDHPNIMKLDGLITSRLSSSVYLVFEYMEHDIAGLSSCPDIKFSESQVKCYMHQLLSGLEHCHSRGVMHRDIKGSNLLVNNEGVLKLADFGLANYVSPGNKQPLTSRVVTLWYRPPELLLGSTSYGEYVDLWSVGCVFAELLLGKPILKGRTEVEQLHKIFKLCGSPPDEYWKKFKLPHATIFKPQNSNESCLSVTCKGLPTSALNLIQTFLSIEPYKRGTASSALKSKYFTSKPYACPPSTLPKYPPNKEIDARSREEARRRKAMGRARRSETIRRRTKVSNVLPEPNMPMRSSALNEELQVNTQRVLKINSSFAHFPKENEATYVKKSYHEDLCMSGPLQVTTPSGFTWAKSRKEDLPYNRCSSRIRVSSAIDPSSVLQTRTSSELKGPEIGVVLYGCDADSGSHDFYAKSAMQKHWSKFERLDSFDDSKRYHSQGLSAALYQRAELPAKRSNLDEDRADFSGPLLTQSYKVDELLERQELRIRRAVRNHHGSQRGNFCSQDYPNTHFSNQPGCRRLLFLKFDHKPKLQGGDTINSFLSVCMVKD